MLSQNSSHNKRKAILILDDEKQKFKLIFSSLCPSQEMAKEHFYQKKIFNGICFYFPDVF